MDSLYVPIYSKCSHECLVLASPAYLAVPPAPPGTPQKSQELPEPPGQVIRFFQKYHPKSPFANSGPSRPLKQTSHWPPDPPEPPKTRIPKKSIFTKTYFSTNPDDLGQKRYSMMCLYWGRNSKRKFWPIKKNPDVAFWNISEKLFCQLYWPFLFFLETTPKGVSFGIK